MKTVRLRTLDLPRSILGLACILFAIPFAIYIFTGTFIRYSGDDYCYGAILTENGFWKAQWVSYFQVSMYNGNRYALTLFSHLSGLPSPWVNGLLPGLAILLWLGGLFCLFSQATKRWGRSVHFTEPLFLAELVVFFSLSLAPNFGQSLYWRSGMLTYLAPLVADAWLGFLILRYAARNRPSILGILPVFSLALGAGGFSETATALQGSALGLAFGLGWTVLRGRPLERQGFLQATGAALAGTVCAILLLYLSPTNLVRFEITPGRPDFPTLIGMAISNSWLFIRRTTLHPVLPSLAILSLMAVAAFLYLPPENVPPKRGLLRLALTACLAALASFCLITACMIPFAYVQKSYPDERSLIIPVSVLVLTLAAEGALAGRGARLILQRAPVRMRFLQAIALVVFGLLALYPLPTARTAYTEIPRFRRWATFWDARDQTIRAAQAEGKRRIEVMVIDHIIPKIGDLRPNPRHWHNVCAARYYGMRSITANQPGWDDD